MTDFSLSRNPLFRVLAAAGLALLLSAPLALAVQPDEMLKDPQMEQRARDISRGLRCVVCQNESIDDSNADLARDLRLLVRDRLTKGDSNDQVIQYVVDRYGDYVLLRPPFKATTLALWAGPFVFVLIALGIGWRLYGRPDQTTPTPAPGSSPPKTGSGPTGSSPLTAEERRRLDKLLRNEEGTP